MDEKKKIEKSSLEYKIEKSTKFHYGKVSTRVWRS